MTNIAFFTIFILIIPYSCTIEPSKENKLVTFYEKYKDSSFTEFTGLSFSKRGFDNQNNTIVLVYNNNNKNKVSCRASYRVIAHPTERKVVEVNSYYANVGSCHVDSTLATELAVKFLTYNISFLSVDSLNTVTFSIGQKEGPPNLIKFDKASNPNKFVKGWKHLGNNWYMKLD